MLRDPTTLRLVSFSAVFTLTPVALNAGATPKTRPVDVGFNAQNLVLFRVAPQLNRYDEQRTRAFYDDLVERLRAIPGVRGATASSPALLSGSVNSTGIFVQGRTYTRTRAPASIDWSSCPVFSN